MYGIGLHHSERERSPVSCDFTRSMDANRGLISETRIEEIGRNTLETKRYAKM